MAGEIKFRNAAHGCLRRHSCRYHNGRNNFLVLALLPYFLLSDSFSREKSCRNTLLSGPPRRPACWGPLVVDQWSPRPMTQAAARQWTEYSRTAGSKRVEWPSSPTDVIVVVLVDSEAVVIPARRTFPCSHKVILISVSLNFSFTKLGKDGKLTENLNPC